MSTTPTRTHLPIATTGNVTDLVQDLVRAAGGVTGAITAITTTYPGVGVLTVNRDDIETHAGRTLTGDEWADVTDHLTRFTTAMHHSTYPDTLTAWIDQVLPELDCLDCGEPMSLDGNEVSYHDDPDLDLDHAARAPLPEAGDATAYLFAITGPDGPAYGTALCVDHYTARNRADVEQVRTDASGEWDAVTDPGLGLGCWVCLAALPDPA